MSYPSEQIGWSQEAKLLQNILKQLNRLATVIGSSNVSGFQPLNQNLTGISLLSPTANTLPYSIDSTTWGVTSLSSFARTLIDDTNAVGMRTTLEIPINTYRSGRYYSNNLSGSTTSNQALTANTLRAFRWRVDTTLNFNEIISEVTTLAAANYRIAIYTDVASYPTTLIAGSDALSYDASGTGVKSSGAINVTINPGFYWIAFNSNGTPTLRAHGTANILNVGADVTMGANAFTTCVSASQTFGAMPSSFPAGGTFSNLACPIAAFRAV